MIFIITGLLLNAVTAVQASNFCSFRLNASGGITGPVWQLKDGQFRLGGDHEGANFRIEDGGITDFRGSGCILTPEVRQVQCDRGIGPLHGFSIGENGILSYNQSPTFYACPASEVEWNVYTIPVVGQLKCVSITLTADNCGAPAYHAPLPPVYQPPPPPPKYEAPAPSVYQPPPPAPMYQAPPPKDLVPPPPSVYHTSAYQATTVPAYYNPAPSVSACPNTLISVCIPSANYGGQSSCTCIPTVNHGNLYVTPTPAYYTPTPKYEPPKYETPKYKPPKYETPKYEPPKYETPKYETPKYETPTYSQPKYGQPDYGNPYSQPYYAGPLGEEYDGPPGATPTLVVPNLIGGLLGGMMENILPTGVPHPQPDSGSENAEALSNSGKSFTGETIKIIAPQTYYTGPQLKVPEEEAMNNVGDDKRKADTIHAENFATPQQEFNVGTESEEHFDADIEPEQQSGATIARRNPLFIIRTTPFDSHVNTAPTPAPTVSSGFRTEVRHPISASEFSDSTISSAIAAVKEKRKLKHKNKLCFFPYCYTNSVS